MKSLLIIVCQLNILRIYILLLKVLIKSPRLVCADERCMTMFPVVFLLHPTICRFSVYNFRTEIICSFAPLIFFYSILFFQVINHNRVLTASELFFFFLLAFQFCK